MDFLLIMVVLVAVAVVVFAPLRSDRSERGEDPEVAALEAERDAKLREIRDFEIDFETGKLSLAEHRALDLTLRAEAAAILRRLDAAREGSRERRVRA
ncbi:MAG TPA: hypothetical protein VF752_12555 [Thermoleophilaceae bacterium]